MLKALGSIEHQFEQFVTRAGLAPAKEAKLLVSSVKPGSIDIGLLPDFATMGTIVAPAMVYSEPVLKFVGSIKDLLDKFKKKDDPEDSTSQKDCTDAINIARPIASSGGTQTFNVFKGDVYHPVFQVSGAEAQRIVANATQRKALLEAGESEVAQRVPLVWHGMDTGEARTDGKRSPDKAIIEEIDNKERPVFFQDDFSHIKKAMIDDQENPYKKVYFVDVTVSRVGGKVVSYRVIGYHGSEDLD